MNSKESGKLLERALSFIQTVAINGDTAWADDDHASGWELVNDLRRARRLTVVTPVDSPTTTTFAHKSVLLS